MKKILILVLVALGFSAAAQNSVYQGVYSKQGDLSKSPDAEYQLIRRHYTLNADGTSEFNFRKEITIIRNKALTAYADKGESFIVWNPDFQTLKINECYTIQADGKRVDMPKAGFIEQLPSNCVDCGRYNNIREMAIVHTGMEYGCTIVLDYTIKSKSAILDERLIIPQDCPVKKYEVIVDAPKNAQPKTNFTNALTGAPAFNCETQHNEESFRVVYTNVGQTYVDSYLPAAEELYPIVTISNKEQAQPIASFESVKDAEILLTTELQDNDKLTWAKNICTYVNENIKTNDIPLSTTNYKIAPAQETWASNCGTKMDKAVLLASLLHQVGFDKVAVSAEGNVIVVVEGTEYTILPHSSNLTKAAPASNEAPRFVISGDVPFQPTPMAGNYYKVKLPSAPGSLSTRINPAALSSMRKAPLQVANETESYSQTITLPDGMKMVGKPIAVKKALKGLGTMEINIRQEGSKIIATRSLTIERDIIKEAKEYKAFRQWMQLWWQYNEIIVK